MMKKLGRNIIMIGVYGLCGATTSALMLTPAHAQDAVTSAVAPAASGFANWGTFITQLH
jgi:hypothetical protein